MNDLIKRIQEKIPEATSFATEERTLSFEIASSRVADFARLMCEDGFRLLTMAANDRRSTKNRFEVYYVFGLPEKNILCVAQTPIDPQKLEFPSIMSIVYSARLFELEIRDMFGLVPVGNLDLVVKDKGEHDHTRRLIHHHNWPEGLYPLRKDFPLSTRPPEVDIPFPFRHALGEGVFEIPVGPIHAGVIEPGHFHFTAVGEMVLDLKIRLYYTHKGIEKLFESKNLSDAVPLSERISGDTSFGHSLAFCEAVENLGKITVPERAQVLRMIFLEMERIYNHVGDIGMIGLDAAFAFAGAQGSRLKELVMRLNGEVSGSRVLRGLNAVGGLTKDIPKGDVEKIDHFFAAFEKDFTEFTDVLCGTSSLLDRLETTGRLLPQIALDYNTVGYVARASGLRRDARKDFPSHLWPTVSFDVPVRKEGDVFARFSIRIDEVRQSIRIIRDLTKRLTSGPVQSGESIRLPEGKISVSVVEGWRGEVVYFMIAGPNNTLYRVKVRDASFLNWPTLSQAILNNIVPDFPLCNKSYDMSYSGNDL